MAKAPQLTPQTTSVLEKILKARGGELAGSEIAAETKLQSGTLYPILIRLEKAGWLSSRWEDGDPAVLGRPRRRFYRVTGVGQRALHAHVADMASKFGRLSWS